MGAGLCIFSSPFCKSDARDTTENCEGQPRESRGTTRITISQILTSEILTFSHSTNGNFSKKTRPRRSVGEFPSCSSITAALSRRRLSLCSLFLAEEDEQNIYFALTSENDDDDDGQRPPLVRNCRVISKQHMQLELDKLTSTQVALEEIAA